MNRRRLILLLISPVLLLLAAIAIVVGLAYSGGSDVSATIASSIEATSPEVEQLAEFSLRCMLVPFQLIFIGLVIAAALAVYRRRWQIATRALGALAVTDKAPEVATRFDPLHDDWEQLITLRPQRQQTLTHITASIVAVTTIVIALILVMGQFVSLTDLAIVITALTSALAWGARLPVSDVLGGISNLIENNFYIGDRISYRHFRLDVEGIVEQVNLRFTWLRSPSGELVTVPFGEIRTLRNFERSTFSGVYVSFVVPDASLEPAVRALEGLAPRSVELIPGLLEPWRVVSQEGVLAANIELSLYGRAAVGSESEVQMAMHTLVWENLPKLDPPPAEDESS